MKYIRSEVAADRGLSNRALPIKLILPFDIQLITLYKYIYIYTYIYIYIYIYCFMLIPSHRRSMRESIVDPNSDRLRIRNYWHSVIAEMQNADMELHFRLFVFLFHCDLH